MSYLPMLVLIAMILGAVAAVVVVALAVWALIRVIRRNPPL